MSDYSKAQKAALLEITCSFADFERKIPEERHKYVQQPYGTDFRFLGYACSLNKLASELDKCVRSATAVAHEYRLEDSVISEFRRKMIEGIYSEAGRRGEHAWQAQFAKKHGM